MGGLFQLTRKRISKSKQNNAKMLSTKNKLTSTALVATVFAAENIGKPCFVGELQSYAFSFNAEFRDPKCNVQNEGTKDEMSWLDTGKKCKATCQEGYVQEEKGTFEYVCANAEWEAPQMPIKCVKDGQKITVDDDDSDDTTAEDGQKTCKVSEKFVETITELNAEFKEGTCEAESEIKEGDSCEASCVAPATGKNVKYTCKNGKFNFRANKIKCSEVGSSFAQVGVLGALVCLFAFN